MVWDLTETRCPECGTKRLNAIIITMLRNAVLPRLQSAGLTASAGLLEQALGTADQDPRAGRRQLARAMAQIQGLPEGSDTGGEVWAMLEQASAATRVWDDTRSDEDPCRDLTAAHAATMHAARDSAERAPLLIEQIRAAINACPNWEGSK